MNISGGRSLTPIFRQNLIGSGIDETLNDTLLHFGLRRGVEKGVMKCEIIYENKKEKRMCVTEIYKQTNQR